MVVLDDQGNQHELSEVDCPSYEWKKIGPGAIITLTISESVTGWRVKASRVEEHIKELIAETREKVSGPFFLWICQYCGVDGYVKYEDGDDTEEVAERMVLAIQKEAQPGCEHSIRIYDHRGERRRESELLLSSRLAVKAA